MNDNYYYYNYNYNNYNNNGIHSTAFPQNGSSSAGIQVINLSNIGQAAGQHWGDSPTPFKKCWETSVKKTVVAKVKKADQLCQKIIQVLANGLTSPPKDGG